MRVQSAKLKVKSYSLKFPPEADQPMVEKVLQKIINFGLCIAILHFALLTFNFNKAYAEGISLSVYPSVLEIEALPPADARAPLSIENKSDEPVSLKIGYKLFRASETGNGQITFLKDSDPFPGANKAIFEKIEVIDDTFSIDSLELGPKQKKDLVLRVMIPKDEPHSDYYFSLIFLATPEKDDIDSLSSEDEPTPSPTDPGKTSASTAKGGIALNVLLSVGPKDNPKGYLEKFSTPWYRESGPVPFAVEVKNAGAHFISPKGVILIKNMFGQTVGKVELAPDNILAGTTRALIDKAQAQSAQAEQQTADSDPRTIWPEKFLLGLYTADLSLAISDNGPVYTRSIYFVAFPIKLLLGISISIMIIALAYLRVKKKLKEK